MPRQLQALLMMCAAAAVVSLAGVVRWMDLHRAEGEVLEQREIRVVEVPRGVDPAQISAPREFEPNNAVDVASVAGPKGASRIVVTLGGEPLAGAAVELVDASGTVVQHGATGADGSLVVDGAITGEFTLRASVVAMTRVHSTWAAGTATRRVDFGHAALEGVAYDCDGRPMAYAELLVRQSQGDSELWRSVQTDSSGRYRCNGLVEGPVRLEEVERALGAAQARTAGVKLGEAELARLDLGQPDVLVEWSGTLRTELGRAIDEPLDLLVVETQRGWVERVRCDDLGGFAVALRSGDWVAQVASIDGVLEVARVELRDRPVVQDAVLRGTCLRARLACTGSSFDGSEGDVQISIWSEGSEDLRVFRPRAGRCVVAGLSPGRWEFAAHRVGLEPRSEGALQVFDGQDVLDIELPLLWEALEEP
jgi:hypothetical protein